MFLSVLKQIRLIVNEFDHFLVFVDFTWNGNFDAVVEFEFFACYICVRILARSLGDFFWNAFFGDGQLCSFTCERFFLEYLVEDGCGIDFVLFFKLVEDGLLRCCQCFVRFLVVFFFRDMSDRFFDFLICSFVVTGTVISRIFREIGSFFGLPSLLFFSIVGVVSFDKSTMKASEGFASRLAK